MSLSNVFEQVKEASRSLALINEEEINAILLDVADATDANTDEIIAANQADLAKMDQQNPLYDRVKLTAERIKEITADMRKVAELPSPLGKIQRHHTLPNGLDLTRVSVPFGVIGIVYEARPNVTFDVFSLCLKSGNACVLKGGKDADCSNKAIINIIKGVLNSHNINEHILELLPATHEATAEMLHANGLIDLVIPRGSSRLIQFVRQEATIPVIETGAGVCHAYFDKYGDLEKGKAIVNNAKTRRVSVCNALDCLLIHKERLTDLADLCEPLQANNVRIFADKSAKEALDGHYPSNLLDDASDESYGTEFLSYTMAIKTISSIDEVISHINLYGSGHSECIISEDSETTDRFLKMIDAACVYSNAPTSFTDGAQFGLGAEIGISTQKLHARGPMALEEIVTYKWIIRGNGQTRK